ncbi:hypothetical protein DV735_g3566, partial [Chaetothyriales sp. CBS 134920]
MATIASPRNESPTRNAVSRPYPPREMDTPTSLTSSPSVRASVELTPSKADSNASSSPAPTPANSDTPSSSGAPLLAKLDDPSFEADEFVSSLLASGSLQEILRTEAVLVSEVRNLDGECKALVYDNYSKLIKA